MLGTELGHLITERAVVVAEGVGDLGHRAMVQEERPQGLVTALQRMAGAAEEILATGLVHGGTSKIVTHLSRETAQDGMVKFSCATRPADREMSGNAVIYGENV